MRRVWFSVAFFYGVALAAQWIFELLDIPSRLFGEEPTPVNWAEALLETGFLLVAGFATLLTLRTLLRRIHVLEGMYSLCSSCKSVRVEGEWVPMEEFMARDSSVSVSHGLCPKCASRLYPDLIDADGNIKAVPGDGDTKPDA